MLKSTCKHSTSAREGAPGPVGMETLEARLLMRRSYAWGGWPHQIGLDKVAATYGNINGRGESIAVIDTGINWNHPSLGNGKLGYGAKVRAGWNFIDNNANYMDTDGHGTAVAGVLAADPYLYKSHRYEGIAPQAQLLALKVDDGVNDPPASRIRAALQWVIYYKSRYNIVSVNISEGTGLFSDKTVGADYGDLLQQLANMGVFVAAAAGNDGSSTQVEYPGADFNVASVGSVDSGDELSYFTDAGRALDLLAPGEDVVAPAFINGVATYTTVTGTSLSTPMIAGAAALVHQANPTFSTQQILSTLQNTGRSDVDTDSGMVYQRLDLFSALGTSTRAYRLARRAFAR
jgi:subtilisin family serine protease